MNAINYQWDLENTSIETVRRGWRLTDTAVAQTSGWDFGYLNRTEALDIRSTSLSQKNITKSYAVIKFYNKILQDTLRYIGRETQNVTNDKVVPLVMATFNYLDAAAKCSASCKLLILCNYTYFNLDYDLFAFDYSRRQLYDTLHNSGGPVIDEYVRYMKSSYETQKINRLYAMLGMDDYNTAVMEYPLDKFNQYSNVYLNLVGNMSYATLDYYILVKGAESEKNLVILVILVIGVVLFAASAFISNFFLSTSISGPWSRLNKLQETTIKKFMPQGFLNLIKCKNISEVRVGLSNTCQLTMMQVEITNFDFCFRGFNSDEILSMLNCFLNHVCPLVRLHGGFVEKYNHDGFNALFKSATNAIKAAVDIRQNIDSFCKNNEEYAFMRTGIAIHAAQVLVGTVGEDERMDGAIISEEIDMIIHLLRVHDKLNVPIVSSDSITLQSAPDSRFLGKTLDRHGKEVVVLEIYARSDHSKKQTRELFNAASKSFTKKEFYKAEKQYGEVLSIDPDDFVCKKLLEICKNVLSRYEVEISKLGAADILSKPELRAFLQKQCISENSSENYDLYVTSEIYKTLDNVERRRCADYIYKTFLDPSGRRSVNVREKTINAIRDKIQNKQELNQDLVNDVMKQMIINLNDTATRVIDSAEFKQVFVKIDSKQNYCII
ncbi:hypothetical protein AKO1_005718 [Acrasis kona]|uniref:RGS domain-containing protein n=1 Tax=Acrasis kona TaxID=1008807 RepID=A0AAW2YK27_9EUKA